MFRVTRNGMENPSARCRLCLRRAKSLPALAFVVIQFNGDRLYLTAVRSSVPPFLLYHCYREIGNTGWDDGGGRLLSLGQVFHPLGDVGIERFYRYLLFVEQVGFPVQSFHQRFSESAVVPFGIFE